MTGVADSEEFRKRLLNEAGVAVLADIHFVPAWPERPAHPVLLCGLARGYRSRYCAHGRFHKPQHGASP